MDFTKQQLLVIKALADGIFPPAPGTPAASDLPVAEMFASIARTWEVSVFQATANALDAINNISLAIFSQSIDQLTIEGLAYVTDVLASNEDMKPFWEPFRILIALSYYGLPPAYEAIGLPGPSIDKGGFTADGYPA